VAHKLTSIFRLTCRYCHYISNTMSQPVQPNQSLLEGIEILLEVARRDEAVRVRPLARELGLTPTRLQRYLGTLAHAGLLKQNEDSSYGVGPGIHALSAISLGASGLARRAMSILPAQCRKDDLVALGVTWRREVSYLYFHSPGEESHLALEKTAGYPAEQSAIGLALLAQQEDEQIERLYAEDAAALLPRLQEIRDQGYARTLQPDGRITLALCVGSPAIAALALARQMTEVELPAHLSQLQNLTRMLETP